MALQVWLPLDGDLRNQGLSDTIVTNNGTTVENNGKIGKCYKFDGDQYLSLSTGIDTNSDYSICYWVKEFENNTLSQFRVIYQCGYLIVGQYGSALDIYNSGASGMDVTASIDTTSWQHACFTYKADIKQVTIYINGELKKQSIVTSVPTSGSTALIGKRSTGTYLFQGFLSDFRLFNHTLSPKEVKEISKGLILHYQLKDSYIEGTTNISNGLLSSSCYNGATDKYSYGATTDIYRETGIFNGQNCTKVYMGTNGLDAHPYIFFNDIHPGRDRYKTVSFDYYPTIGDYVVFYTYRGSGLTTYIVNGIANMTENAQATIPVKLNSWNHISVTIKGTSDTDSGYGYMKIGAGSHVSNTSNYWLFANIQIEHKDHETGYTKETRKENTKNLVTGLTAGGRTTVADNVITTAGQDLDTYFYLNLSSAMVSGRTYTISCQATGVTANQYWCFPIAGQGNGSIGLFKIRNGYNYLTFVANDTCVNAGTKVILDDTSNTINRTVSCRFFDFQLEEKPYPTPFVGYNTTYSDEENVYDCSGYQNNGTATGSLITSIDTPRYSRSYKFASNNTAISVPKELFTSLSNEVTCSFWAKVDSWNLAYETFFALKNGTGYSWNNLIMYIARGGSNEEICFSITDGSAYTSTSCRASFSTGSWHHVCCVHTNSSLKMYIDGELKSDVGKTVIPAFSASANAFIGAVNATNSYQSKSRMSDFRIYATALSAADVLELYSTGASITNTGAVMAYELSEG